MILSFNYLTFIRIKLNFGYISFFRLRKFSPMKSTFCFIALVMLSLLSCRKEDAESKAENIGLPLIIKIIHSNDRFNQEYAYNRANLVAEEKSLYSFVKHYYNSDNSLAKTEIYFDERLASSDWETAQAAMNRTEWVTPENTPLTFSQTFIYSDERLSRVNETRRNGYKGYSVFDYDEAGRISRQSYYYEERVSSYSDFLYDDKGNLIKMSRYWVSVIGKATLSFTREYTFDNYFNPFKVFIRLQLPGVNTNENNIVKETYNYYSDSDGSLVSTSSTDYSYLYNSLGYPIIRDGSIQYEYN
jgi:hypothetical protein